MELPIYIKRESVTEKNTHNKLPHWHNDIEIIYVLKGNLECQTNESTFPLNKGDLCFINKNQLHHLYDEGKQASEHISLIVSTSILTQNKEIYDKYISEMIDDISFSHIKFDSSFGNANKIHDLMLDIESLLEKKESAYELEVIADIHMIFKYLYCAYVSDNKISVVDENVILEQKMIKFIQNNDMKEIDLDDIAAAANVSRSKCFRLFKEYTRMSPIIYLNNYRLETAASMLINSRDTVLNISINSGFSQQSYFNRAFLKEYGMTPLEYRKKNKKEIEIA